MEDNYWLENVTSITLYLSVFARLCVRACVKLHFLMPNG